MTQLGSTDLKRLHREWRRRTPGRLALVLDDVQGPFNVGGILRTAAAYRTGEVWTTPRVPGPDHPGVRRTSMGCARYLQLHDADSGAEAVAAASASGYRTVAVELTPDAVPLHQLDLVGDVCLVLGNEDHGVHRATLAACDAAAYLPLLGRVGSLNVAAAGTAAIYEWARQQWSAPPSGA